MKKKFIAVYALIGVLALGSTALTSCVDDNESASVTAIRTAKAEQLAALAAQAEAAARLSDAQAAVQNAQAEATSQSTEQQKQEFAARLAMLQAQYAYQEAQYNKLKAQEEQAIVTGLATHQATLYENYTTAQQKVVDLRKEIVDLTLDLSYYEADLASAKALAEQNILNHRTDSIEEEAKKAVYLAMADNGYDEKVKEQAEKQVEETEKLNALTAATNAVTAAEEALKKAQTAYHGYTSEYNPNPTDPSSSIKEEYTAPTTKVGQAIETLKKLYNNGKEADAEETDKLVGALHEYNMLTKAPQYVDANSTTKIDVYSLKASAVTSASKYLAEQIKTKNDNLGKSDGSEAGTNYATLKGYKDAWDQKVKEEATATDKEAAAIASQEAKAAYESYLENTINPALDKIEELTNVQKALNDAVAAFSGDDYKAYTDAVTATLAKEGKAVDTAKAAETTAKLELAAVQAELDALAELVGTEDEDGTLIDIDEKIAECDKNIAEATKNIADERRLSNKSSEESEYILVDATITVTNPDGSTEVTETQQYIPNPNYSVDSELAIYETAKAELENLQQELENAIALAELREAEFKASLESDTAEDTPATDTPAEGEETPAA